jgi:hypothetical protein
MGDMYADSGYGSAGKVYGCRAWANFVGIGTIGGSVIAFNGSGNISSTISEYQGFFRVNFATPMPDNNYAVSLAMSENGDAAYNGFRKAFGNQFMLLANGEKNYVTTKDFFRCMTMFGNALGGGWAAQVHIAVFR